MNLPPPERTPIHEQRGSVGSNPSSGESCLPDASRGDSPASLVVLVLTDLGAKMSGLLSMLALARGRADVALYSAAALNVFAVWRGFAGGRALERGLSQTWSELAEATCRQTVSDLEARGASLHWAALMDAAGHVAHFRSIVKARAASHAIMLLVVALFVGASVGWGWVVAGGSIALLFGPGVWWGHRRLGRQRQAAFDHFAEASAMYAVLLDGALQLRAHGAQVQHVWRLSQAVSRMAGAERRSHTIRAWLNVLPLAASLLLLLLPFGSWVNTLSTDTRMMAELGVLAAASLAALAGLVGVAQSWAQARPGVQLLRRFSRESGAAMPPLEGVLGSGVRVKPRDDVISIAGLRMRYPGAEEDSPSTVQMSWEPKHGLALVGDNGSGKSTLAQCMMGLITPSEGKIAFSGVPLASVDLAELHRNIAYIPQRPLVVPDRSVAWHLRQFCALPVDDETIERALVEVDLAKTSLEAKRMAARTLGSLSGGERKRAHLARVHLAEPVFIILDEPEAGLDLRARLWLRTYVQRLALRARVLLVVHDESVIPPEFVRLRCARG